MIFNIDLARHPKSEDKLSIIQHDQMDGDDLIKNGKPKTVKNNPVVVDSIAVSMKPDIIEVNKNNSHSKFEEIPERGNWTSKYDFILSSLGYAVGLGNIWRFPYLCYRNGGGAFMIPYLIFLFIIGMPLFFVEVGLGQFSSNGPFTCWEYAPIFTGIGYGMAIISTLVAVYYNVIVSYSVYYMFASMANPLPWESCNNSWNTQDCRHKLPIIENCTMTKALDGTCMNNENVLGIWNYSLFVNVTNRHRRLPAEEYFNNEVLGISKDISFSGQFQWKLVLCLFSSWVIVFLCLFKGIKISGKIVYFTAVFPYVVLLILFFRGIILDGAGDGIAFYIIPNMTKLAEATVWKDAANQIFFSLSASWGGLITLSSYNKFHNNILRDTIFVSLSNSATSIFAGFVIFSYLGYLSKLLKTPVSSVADKGIGLAFVIYPEAVATMPGSYIWAVLFFFMLLTLGVDSQFTTIETVVTGFVDLYPKYLRPKKTFLLFLFIVALFLLGLPLTTTSGPYWLQLMDTYCGGWSILLIGIIEVVSIGWIYGRPGFKFSKTMRFKKDIELMLKRKISNWWRICWQYLTPLLMTGIIFFSWVDYTRAKYGDRIYPIWADFIGWMMTISSLSVIPGAVIFLVVKERRINPYHSIKRILMDLTIPTYKWGPVLPIHRLLVAQQLEDTESYYIDVAKRLKYNDYISQTNQAKYLADSNNRH